MLVGCLTIFTMLLYGYIACKTREASDIVECLTLSQMFFWCGYTIISGILIWIDWFSIRLAAMGTAMIAVITIIILIRGQWRTALEGLSQRLAFKVKHISILAMSVLGIFLLQDKFELYGLSQDEGVYQTTAISYLYSNNDNQKTLVEYEILNEEDRLKFSDKMEELRKTAMHGFYIFDETLKPRNVQMKRSEMSGFYHGVGTYPAQLALWAWIFGINNMMNIQTLFWVLAILLVYLIFQQFKIPEWIRVMLTGLYALTPIMLWTCRASLTELFLACLINFFIYELCREDAPNPLLMSLPIMAFSFCHLTVFTIMPLVCICFAVKFLCQRNKSYLVGGLLSIFGYAAGILFICWSHTEYFYLNVQMLFNLPFASQDNVIIVMLALGGLGCIPFILLWVLSDKLPDQRALSGKWLLRILTGGLAILGIYQVAQRLSEEGYGGNPTLLSYCMQTGIFFLPLCVLLLICYSEAILKSGRHAVMSVMFLYCIFLYSTTLRVDTLYHYYGDRYLLPYIALIPLCIGTLLEFGWNRIVFRVAVSMCAAVSLVYLLPHDKFILENMDDTRMQWDTLLKIAEKPKPGDILILQDDIMTSCFFPLRDIAGVYCFPVFGEGVEDTYEKLKGFGRDVYLLSNGKENWREDIWKWTWNVRCFEYEEKEDTWDPLAMEVREVRQRWTMQKMGEQ